jgi:hypothetical protein
MQETSRNKHLRIEDCLEKHNFQIFSVEVCAKEKNEVSVISRGSEVERRLKGQIKQETLRMKETFF